MDPEAHRSASVVNLRVLITESYPDALEVYAASLRVHGFDVTAAGDRHEALEIARA
jgi:CheY-like chemotaxis protein